MSVNVYLNMASVGEGERGGERESKRGELGTKARGALQQALDNHNTWEQMGREGSLDCVESGSK